MANCCERAIVRVLIICIYIADFTSFCMHIHGRAKYGVCRTSDLFMYVSIQVFCVDIYAGEHFLPRN